MSRLHVGNLPHDAREDDLRRIFGEKAQIREVIMKNGFAYVEYNDPDTAENVRRDLDGTDYGGRQLRVEKARPRAPREERRSGDDRRPSYGDDRRYDDRYAPPPPPPPPRDSYGGGAAPSYYDDRRNGYDDRPRYDDRGRGGYDDRRGGYDDRRGGYDDRRGGYERGGYERGGGYDRRDERRSSPYGDRDRSGPRTLRHPRPHSSEFGLVVDGLPRGTDWRDLKDHFRSAGNVCYANIDSNGQGIVQFETEEALLVALKSFDGSQFRGSTIIVTRGGSGGGRSSIGGDQPQRSPSPQRSPLGN